MNTQLIDDAAKKIPNIPVLVNVVSKRVKQLTNGHKPMVDVLTRMGLADIALTEIIEGKLSFETESKSTD